MAIGDVFAVDGCPDLHYVDTGMYDTEEYGAVYIVDAEQPALVDTGIGTRYENILDALDTVGIAREELAYVLPTHVHLDHAGGAGFLAEACPNATVLTHEIGVPHLVDPSRLVAGTKAAVESQWQFYAEPKPVPEDRIEGLEGGDEVDLGDHTLDVHHAPGHAPHQVMFHDHADDVLFTADAAGIWIPSIERLRQTSPPANFDLEASLADVETIQEIDPETLCFGHFGPREYEEPLMDGYARILEEWVAAVRERRAELGDDEAVIDYFVAETGMDEVWSARKAQAEERLNVRGVLAFLDEQ
ncbi:MBL fold metallo-hydrolase [Halococcus sp. IIIV-5B]|uniref:MBL fold metallo-hydrolase n=1 Tax=Halococcus sp. IIIV-5B TaxID=2321230 RepID=UPI000E736E16|nr:MBL fold metallo-hydrolase [Halococcus sp. IIIV-5B]RJT04389.1 MBL fold metallo-hydrolase [Halococcus sp. IIIV-5B]